MKHPAAFPISFFALLVLLILTSCENETYDTGDGKYSYLRADFGEIRTGAPAVALSGVTDDGMELTFATPYATSWATKGDTIYRALIYYKGTENGKVEAQAVSRVPVVQLLTTARPDTLKFDPLTFESAWVSKNGKYINIGFIVKTGQEDGVDALQTIGVMRDAVVTRLDGTRQLPLHLYHNQAGVPQYYSAKSFLSIPLKDVNVDEISISIPTYKGVETRVIEL